MIGRRILYGISLFVCGAFHLFYQDWFSWILFLFVLLLPWCSLLISLPAMLRIRIDFSIPKQVEMGTKVKVSVTLYGSFPLLPHRYRLRVTQSPVGKKRVLRKQDLLPTDHCGGLTVEPYRAKVYDYLGLFSKKLRSRGPMKLCVMPHSVKPPISPDLSRGIALAWRPKTGGSFGENYEIRPYHAGDMLNLVHWKLTAKVGELMVREPMVPEHGRLLLTLKLMGTPEELDEKMGQLLWLGTWLLEQEVSFFVFAQCGDGLQKKSVLSFRELKDCMESLLFAPLAEKGKEWEEIQSAAWQYSIGGEERER